MIRVKISISGEQLMMHKMNTDFTQQQVKKKIAKDNFETQAKMAAYTEDDGTLYFPSDWIVGTMIQASKFFKKEKPPLSNVIAGLVSIKPAHISLNTKKYEVDVRNVHNFKAGRFPVGRPLIKDWKASFTFEWNPEILSITPASLKSILTMAGQAVGIGSYRPAHTGPFGRFEITGWEEEVF